MKLSALGQKILQNKMSPIDMTEGPGPAKRLREVFTPDNWVWDQSHKSPEVMLSSTAQAAYFHVNPLLESTGTAGVRGTKGFEEGEHYWEVEFIEAPIGTSVMVGVGTQQALLHTDNYQFVNLIGKDEHSWGLSYKGTVWHKGESHTYCSPFYDQTTVLGVHLNLYSGTLGFYKNGQCLGQAFTNLPKGEKFYPIISSTMMCTELEVQTRASRYASLQERCLHTLARSLKNRGDAHDLPLPRLITTHISHMMQEK